MQKWVKFQLKIFYCDLIGKLVNLVTKCFEKGGGVTYKNETCDDRVVSVVKLTKIAFFPFLSFFLSYLNELR